MSDIDGITQVLSDLDRLEESGIAVAWSTVSAGVTVLTRAAKAAAIGSTKGEIGGYVKQVGNEVIGRAGIMAFANPGEYVDGVQPHSQFLNSGTRYIAARRNISNALKAAAPKAEAAMRRRYERKVSQVKGSL